ncbi:MAG: PQ-loop domain-containing transporter [Candidatus Woesearchaeota archaeon]
MKAGIKHMSKRKNLMSKRKGVDFLDKVCYVAAVVMPLTTLPQIYNIYALNLVSGVSLWMWVLYFITVLPWVLYAYVHKSRPLMVMNLLWLLVTLIIIAGIFLFG